MKREIKQEVRLRRHKRVKAKIFGTVRRPRLCVFRSNKHIYIQLIDDNKGRTILSASDAELKESSFKKSKIQNSKSQTKSEPQTSKVKNEKQELDRTGKIAVAYEAGKLIAQKALEKKIEKVVFDRGGYQYHGRVKAVADGAREAGVKV